MRKILIEKSDCEFTRALQARETFATVCIICSPFSFIFQLNTNYILSIGNKIPFAHSLPAEEEERERSIFLWLSRIRRMRVNQNPDFPGSARHVILTVKGAAENRSLFAVGGPGASERGVKKNHDLIRNLKS